MGPNKVQEYINGAQFNTILAVLKKIEYRERGN